MACLKSLEAADLHGSYKQDLMKYGITTKYTQVLYMVSPAHLLGAKTMENR